MEGAAFDQALITAQHSLHQLLVRAVSQGDLEAVKNIIEVDPSLVDLALTRNTPILVIAVEKVGGDQ